MNSGYQEQLSPEARSTDYGKKRAGKMSTKAEVNSVLASLFASASDIRFRYYV